MYELILFVFVIFSILIYIYLRWNFNYWQKRGIRGPKPAILVGNFSKSARGEVNYMDELNEIYLKYKNSEKFVGIFSSRNPRLFILDPEIVRQILRTNFSSFYNNESSKWSVPEIDLLRMQSPFVCVGKAWKEKRTEIVSALTGNRIRSSYPAMQEIAHKLSDFLRAHEGQDIDSKELSGRFTLEVIANFIWGIEAGAFNDEKLCHIHDIANKMISQTGKSVAYYQKTAPWPWLRKLYTKRFFPESCDNFYKNLTTNIIEQRLQNPNERSDFLNYLINLSNKKTLSEAQLAGHSTTILIDGFETTALAISHCLLLIGRNKLVQEKLRNEILNNLDSGEEISYERLNELPYLDQCIHETLRLFPVNPTFTKICTTPTILENSDGSTIQLKQGDIVHISAYSFHKDDEFFEKPEEFIPERFDPEIGGYRKYRDRGVFLPFSDGPRMCLGMKLGLLESKIAVAEIVQNFKINLSSSTRLDNRCDPKKIASFLDGGIRLQFEAFK